MTTTNDPLESYIGRFQARLPRMTLAERQDIVDEIRAHVHERVASSGLSIPEVLERLGPPEALALEYNRGTLVSRAGASWSPFQLLKAAFAWAMTGIHGVLILMTGLAGYAGALTCFLIVVARMIFPVQTAIWVTPAFDFGIGSDRPVDAQAFLDNWIQPIFFGFGILFLVLTTMAMRHLLPWMKRWGARAIQEVDLPSLAGARAAASNISREFLEAQTRLSQRVRERWQNG